MFFGGWGIIGVCNNFWAGWDEFANLLGILGAYFILLLMVPKWTHQFFEPTHPLRSHHYEEDPIHS